MTEKVLSFYEELADHYHLIFENWDSSMEQQAKILGPLLASQTSVHPLKILDCACGIGTQAIGFATMGHEAAIVLHYMHYNFCRIHKTLRVTPAMEAGLAGHVWSIEELIELLG